MAFFLTKTVFIHTPKCGGKWIKKHLSEACTVKAREYDNNEFGQKNTEHYAPTWEELGNKKPFAFVRHPITWLASLHNHRIRKRGNWFPDRFPLEKAGTHDWHKFVKNICNHPNWIQEYYDMHVGPYGDKIDIGKMENVEQDLITFLKKHNEPFKEEVIKGQGMKLHKSKGDGTNERLKQLTSDEMDTLYKTQRITFEKYGYSKSF